MSEIPDAPYIREACRRGTDYMYEYVFGTLSLDDYYDEHEDQEEKQ